MILVDDGSTDGTFTAVARAHAADPRFLGLALSRNFGHQVAISAGLEHARGEVVVVMDGDLQDPPEAIGPLWARLREGYDVVYAVRASRPEGRSSGSSTGRSTGS
ncbi:MAG: glycosyltransferase [Isosphaeraceae bacterium]